MGADPERRRNHHDPAHTFDDRDWAAEVAADWHLSLAAAECLLQGGASGAVRALAVRGPGPGRQDLGEAYAQLLRFADQLDVDGPDAGAGRHGRGPLP
jgi:hypothetical protein